MGIAEKLIRIQTEIKAPKSLYNKFGDFFYRNAEGICEAAKPFLKSEKLSLTLSDEIVDVGGRIYIKATAALRDAETSEVLEVSAFAREASTKRGMDDSQITGTASSYARKYALNGLFLLDDSKDADANEYRTMTGEDDCGRGTTERNLLQNGKAKGTPAQNGKAKGTPAQNQAENTLICENEFLIITDLIRKANVNEQKLLNKYQIESFMLLTKERYVKLKRQLEEAIEKAGAADGDGRENDRSIA